MYISHQQQDKITIFDFHVRNIITCILNCGRVNNFVVICFNAVQFRKTLLFHDISTLDDKNCYIWLAHNF